MFIIILIFKYFLIIHLLWWIMKRYDEIDFIKEPILEILHSSHYPKTVRNIERILEFQGLIDREENWKYRKIIGRWLMTQKDIIKIRQDNTQNAYVYIFKENAIKYFPEIIEEKILVNNKRVGMDDE